jgi:hypothetical protein
MVLVHEVRHSGHPNSIRGGIREGESHVGKVYFFDYDHARKLVVRHLHSALFLAILSKSNEINRTSAW